MQFPSCPPILLIRYADDYQPFTGRECGRVAKLIDAPDLKSGIPRGFTSLSLVSPTFSDCQVKCTRCIILHKHDLKKPSTPMPRPKSNKAKDFTDKERFFKLLDRAIKPVPSEDEKDQSEQNDGYTGKRTRPRTSANASPKRSGASRQSNA